MVPEHKKEKSTTSVFDKKPQHVKEDFVSAPSLLKNKKKLADD